MRLPEGFDEERFFAERCPPLPSNFEPQEGEPEAIANLLAKRPFRKKAREEWGERPWRMHRWAYARLTERVDREIGKVLDALDNGPHADQTVVVFTSDHGDMDASHRMEHKTAFYEEAARVPLIVRRPGEPDTGRVDDTHLISNGLDFVPTFCDYLGIEPPAEREGRSFRPLDETGRPAASRPWIKIESEIGRCVVSATHKYARYDRGERAEQLVDLVNDPGELRNAVDDAAQRDALARHRRWYDDAFGRA